MRHLKSGRKLKRTHSHRIALLKNLATSLFEHKKIETTTAKAKELRPYAEALITKAKHALQNEKGGKLPAGQTVDIHNRRIVAKHVQTKAVLQELFDTIAPMVETREGGYCRIVKTGFRRGDATQTSIIELVDWSAPQDGATSKKARKATKKPKAKAVAAKATPEHADHKEPKAPKAPKAAKVVEEHVAEPEAVVAPVVAVVEEAPVAAPVVEEVAPIVATEVTVEPVKDEAPAPEPEEPKE